MLAVAVCGWCGVRLVAVSTVDSQDCNGGHRELLLPNQRAKSKNGRPGDQPSSWLIVLSLTYCFSFSGVLLTGHLPLSMLIHLIS